MNATPVIDNQKENQIIRKIRAFTRQCCEYQEFEYTTNCCCMSDGMTVNARHSGGSDCEDCIFGWRC